MISGRDALHRIDQAIKTARHDVALAGAASESESRQLLEVSKARAALYDQIADIRLTSLDGGKIEGLGQIDAKATALLERHDRHMQTLEEARAQAEALLEQCEAKRRGGEQSLGDAIARHESAAEASRTRLDQDKDYLAQAQDLEKANAIVDHAASKREVAAQTRLEKGKPYEGDAIFIYLWQRKFATDAYKANPLSAMFDRQIARLIRYRDARLNYQRLLDLPERLSEHLAFVEERAAVLAEDIEAYERAALERDGVTDLRDKAASQRADLDRLDAEIEQAEAAHHRARASVGAAAQGKEGPLGEARALLHEAMAQRSIPDLKVLAAQTLTPQDDAMVEELAALRLEQFTLEEETTTTKRRLDSRHTGLRDLEGLRTRFKQARFDSHRSQFRNGDLIDLLLNDFTRGALGASAVWRKVERGHHLRQRDWQDDFGGEGWREGFGLPGRHRTNRSSNRSGGGNSWSQIGRTISREIERELGRSLGGGLGGGLDSIFDLDGFVGGGQSRKPRRQRRPRRTRRRPRSVSMPRIRLPRGGGFKTGGGF